ncbi:restriction endonuclease PLD domain-containing protein [Priestia megaterium]|uniref:restriction endonuclease PLD domain-containing protein n=1 Tax=Priestia megaterium TaxID=1404 RepID=UPI0023DA66E2|nr:restriction endonuclease PLD domain-containing protein [Priestia megaterium]MDF2052990.1 NgoFVII family restriction endonuclease [Priestia megaterium]MDF2062238.1 NgoFVII family restriction endonuclease [Priestia megaterium]
MSIVTDNLLKKLIINPYNEGKQKLKIVSGYASPTFVHHILYALENVHVELTIGMVKHDPITIWEHKEYLKMAEDTKRLNVEYYVGEKPIHSKVIYWEENGIFDKPLAFMGSANFTRNGYINYQETMTQIEPEKALAAFPSEHLLNFKTPFIEELMEFAYQIGHTSRIDTSAVARVVRNTKPSVDLLLTTAENPRKIHSTGGLNWGQRPGREKNQAYIPVQKKIHNINPGFFPEKKVEFTLITDDGESFVCVMAQANNKAIETCHDNSILGKYFRNRLGVSLGEFVTIEHLDNYGRNYITIYKINDETYFMDFS